MQVGIFWYNHTHKPTNKQKISKLYNYYIEWTSYFSKIALVAEKLLLTFLRFALTSLISDRRNCGWVNRIDRDLRFLYFLHEIIKTSITAINDNNMMTPRAQFGSMMCSWEVCMIPFPVWYYYSKSIILLCTTTLTYSLEPQVTHIIWDFSACTINFKTWVAWEWG